VVQACRCWVAWGHQVDLLCAGFPGAAPEETIEGVRCIRGPNEYLFNWWALGKIRELDKKKYDIIVEFISKVPCFLPWRIKSTPLAVMIPHLFGKTAFIELPWPMAAYAYALEQPIPQVYRRCPFWALSNTTAADLVARDIPLKQIEVIYPGVDEGLLHPPSRAKKTSFPSILYIGRLKKYKRIDLIITATAKLLPRFPDLHVYLVGKGDYEPELRRQVAALGVEKAVEFTGFVSKERRRELLQAVWLGVQASTIEGWGLGVFEAGACGTPTIATNVPGLSESVRDGETGILVPSGDAEALATQIAKVLSDAALREKLGATAREWVSRFSWEEMARKSLKFLENAAGQRP